MQVKDKDKRKDNQGTELLPLGRFKGLGLSPEDLNWMPSDIRQLLQKGRPCKRMLRTALSPSCPSGVEGYGAGNRAAGRGNQGTRSLQGWCRVIATRHSCFCFSHSCAHHRTALLPCPFAVHTQTSQLR